ATSSIFKNFTINDEKAAEQVLDALDKAAEQPVWEGKVPFKPPERDPEIIRSRMAKRGNHVRV
ncbi:MAG: hypothetical protein LUF34_09370, partial [Lachnospiraceae bacterium]|nr:hypothetical protein [Lachnospiraceae bacterium]